MQLRCTTDCAICSPTDSKMNFPGGTMKYIELYDTKLLKLVQSLLKTTSSRKKWALKLSKCWHCGMPSRVSFDNMQPESTVNNGQQKGKTS